MIKKKDIYQKPRERSPIYKNVSPIIFKETSELPKSRVKIVWILIRISCRVRRNVDTNDIE